MDDYNTARLRHINAGKVNAKGGYVLYWMQIYRRLEHNHALNHALALAQQHRKPLVIYEGLRFDYPWASPRLHRFVLEGMADNRARAAKLGFNYWPFVATPADPGRGLLSKLAARAAVVVTDDFPCFIIPEQTAALARRTGTPVIAVDGNSVVPVANLGPAVSAAAQLRPRIHRAFAEAWRHRAGRRPRIAQGARRHVDPPFAIWKGTDIDATVAALPLDRVAPVAGMPGGATAATRRLRDFVRRRLRGYAELRSHPAPPDEGHASGLSPYLHFGHIAIEEVVAAVLASTGGWSLDDLGTPGKRDSFYSEDADVSAFLDEAITWRDVGMNWHWSRRADAACLQRALPEWAWRTLRAHASDFRDVVYEADQLEAADTHDPLWNAAQRELVTTGTIHNYLRMLWGKKVIQWSRTPDEAYRTLVHLNNKYALDGRDPNSYTGILWCFGLFDRPWPERKVFGTVRYMSSENTARKFKLQRYLDYVAGL